jgi:hypothetical protein
MIAKAPLAVAEDIRCLGYLEDGGWDMDKLDVEFARMRERVGVDNPHFETVFLTFDACRESVEAFLSQLKTDFEELWLQANILQNDFELIREAIVANLPSPKRRSGSEQLRECLNSIGRRAEYLENHILETADPFLAAHAVKMMRMACMRFFTVAATAQWPTSSGRPESRIKGDKKSKMDYVREVFLAHPDMKVEAAHITAEENFHKVHPGKEFVKLEHVAKKYKTKIKEQCSGQLALNLSRPASPAKT